jgi:hypothetical protein
MQLNVLVAATRTAVRGIRVCLLVSTAHNVSTAASCINIIVSIITIARGHALTLHYTDRSTSIQISRISQQ